MSILKTVFAAILAFLAPIDVMIGWVIGLVIVDLLTGILAARKQNKPVQSRGVRLSILKLTVYLVTLVLAKGVEVYLTNGLIPILNICSTIIGIGELKSVLENLDIIANGSLLKLIITSLQSKISNPED